MKYPALLKTEKDGVVVTFRDIPEALTQGRTYEEALEMAEDALITSMDFYFEDNRQVPLPSKPKENEVLIELPISVASKVSLLNTLLTEHITQADLAKRMGIKPQQVTRIVDLEHTTKIDTLQKALRAVGKELTLSVKESTEVV